MPSLRSTVRHIATYSASIIIGRLASLILLPVYTRYLTPSDYGVLEMLEVTSNVVAVVIVVGIGEALYYFYAAAEDDRARRRVVASAYAMSAVLGLALWIAGHLAAGPISTAILGTAAYARAVQVVSLAVGVSFPLEVGFSHRRAANRSTEFAALQVIRLFLQAATTLYLLIVLRMGYLAVFTSTAITYIVLCLYFGARDMRGAGAREIDASLAIRMLRFGLPLGVAGIAMLFMQLGDRYFLREAVPLALIGIYSLAYKGSILVSQAQQAFSTYWSAQLYSTLREEQGADQYVRMATYYFLAIAAAAVATSAAAGPAVLLLIPKSFHGAIVLIPLLCSAHVLRAMGDFFKSPVLFAGRTTTASRLTIISAVFCAGVYAALIPHFGNWGAAWATFLTYVFYCGISYRTAQKVRRYDFEYARLARIAVTAGVSLAIVSTVNSPSFLVRLASSGVSLAVFATGLLVSGFANATDIALAKRVVAAARNRLQRPGVRAAVP